MIQMQLMSYQVETNELIDYYKSHKTRIHNLVLHYDKKLTNDKIIEVVRNAINDAIESGVLEKKQPAVTSEWKQRRDTYLKVKLSEFIGKQFEKNTLSSKLKKFFAEFFGP